MIELVAAVVTAAITLGVAAIIARHIFSKNEITTAYKYAVWGVSAAEEMFAAGNGQVKFEYVRDILLKRFGLSEEDARMLVNAAVQGLRNAGIKPPKEASNVVPLHPGEAA